MDIRRILKLNCLYCGKETSNPKYCSLKCSASHPRGNKSRELIDRYCKKCGRHLYRENWKSDRRLCEVCRRDQYDTVRDILYTKHHKSSAYALIRSRARAITLKLKKKCQICGYSKHVEICHIKPIASFSIETKISIINDLSNLVLLCPNCHWEFDRGMLDLAGISAHSSKV